MADFDLAIAGGGCAGLATALAAADRNLSVCLFEKEGHLAAHQSGRNSGVLHPGFHLPPGSERAELSRDGARLTAEFCSEYGVPLRKTGFLFVAKNRAEQDRLRGIESRAAENGVPVEWLPDAEAVAGVEPGSSASAGLHCPSVKTVDSAAYVRQLAAAGDSLGVTRRMGQAVQDVDVGDDHVRVQTDGGTVTARYFVNAAGLYADRLAESAGAEIDYRIVPFRGAYYELVPESRDLVETVVYPVPDPDVPFLGAHFMPLPDGRVLVGPTASLAFGREAYDLSGVDLLEVVSTVTYPGFRRLLGSPGVASAAVSEFVKAHWKHRFVADARSLVPSVDGETLTESFAGITAQVVSRHGEMEDGPVVVRQSRAVHVLDPVSLTASLAFGERLADDLTSRLG